MFTLEKEKKLVKKIKRLLRRIGCPRWLHHYGPKTYEFLDHLSALLIRAFCRLSYRRVNQLLDFLGMKCPSKSALHYTAKKLSAGFWQKLLKATSGITYLAAIDSTGFSRTNPSYHYLRRIDGRNPKIPVKMSAAFDTRKKKFCSAKIRVLPAHDIRDVKSLLKRAKPKILAADKAYDAAWLHHFCRENSIKAFIPIRKWSKPKHRNFGLRMKAAKNFKIKTYHRREVIESGFSSIKRKYGSSVNSRSVRGIRTEIYGRLACHNIFFWFFRLLGQSLIHRNFYIPNSGILLLKMGLIGKIRAAMGMKTGKFELYSAFDIKSEITTRPVVADLSNTKIEIIVFGTKAGKLYAVKDGKIEWVFSVSEKKGKVEEMFQDEKTSDSITSMPVIAGIFSSLSQSPRDFTAA